MGRKNSKVHDISSVASHGVERRNEPRTEKQIPLSFLLHKKRVNATLTNASHHGIGIELNKKIALPIGKRMNIKAGDSKVKAHVMWTDVKFTHP